MTSIICIKLHNYDDDNKLSLIVTTMSCYISWKLIQNKIQCNGLKTVA